MALQTKTISSAAAGGCTLKLTLTENSTAAAANTSSVSWRLYVAAGASAAELTVTAYAATVAGVAVCNRRLPAGQTVTVAAGGTATVDSGTLAVSHSADGTKTVTASASLSADSAFHLGGSMVLTPISRLSALEAGDGVLGESHAVTVNRLSSAFTHRLAYACGAVSGVIAANTDKTALTWTPPLSLAGQAGGGRTVPVTLTLTTYSGGTALGSTDKTVTMTIPAGELTAADGTLGAEQTLTLSRPAANLSQTLTYACGALTGQTAGLGTVTGGGTSRTCTFTPPLSLAGQSTAGQTVAVTLTLTTKNGSATVGSVSRTVTMAIPASVKPGCAATVEVVNDNAVLRGWGVAVKGYSRYKVTCAFTPAQGSTQREWHVSVRSTGQTLAASPAVSEVLKTTDRRVKAWVKDSRGRWSDAVSLNGPVIYDHAAPTTGLTAAYRARADGTRDEQGTYLSLRCDAAVSPCGGRNAMTVQYRYRLTGGSWTAWGSLTSGTVKTVNAGLEAARSYEVQLRVADSLGAERTVTVAIPTASVTLHLPAGGRGAAFGGYAQRENTVDFTTWDVVGRVRGLGYCPPIPAGDDLDSYLTPGEYAVNKDEDAAAIVHLPESRAGRLTVYTSTGRSAYAAGDRWKYLTQEYRSCLGGVYRRLGRSGDGAPVSWTDWTPTVGADTVLDGGAAGMWTWRKWHSGLLECWGRKLHSGVDITAPWGALYYAVLDAPEDYPVAFAARPAVGVTLHASGGNGFAANNSNTDGVANAGRLYVVNAAAKTGVDVTVSYQVKGRWR